MKRNSVTIFLLQSTCFIQRLSDFLHPLLMTTQREELHHTSWVWSRDLGHTQPFQEEDPRAGTQGRVHGGWWGREDLEVGAEARDCVQQPDLHSCKEQGACEAGYSALGNLLTGTSFLASLSLTEHPKPSPKITQNNWAFSYPVFSASFPSPEPPKLKITGFYLGWEAAPPDSIPRAARESGLRVAPWSSILFSLSTRVEWLLPVWSSLLSQR